MPETTTETENAEPKAFAKRPNNIFGMLSSRSAELIGIGVTVISASMAATNSIRQNFYKNITKYHVFKDIQEKRDSKYLDIYKQYRDQKNTSDLIHQINKVESEYISNIDNRLSGYGINNIIDRWRTLKSHQKTEAFVAFAGVGALLAGVVASISASRRVEDRQEDYVKELKHMNRKIDTLAFNDTERLEQDKVHSFVDQLSSMNQKIDAMSEQGRQL